MAMATPKEKIII